MQFHHFFPVVHQCLNMMCICLIFQKYQKYADKRTTVIMPFSILEWHIAQWCNHCGTNKIQKELSTSYRLLNKNKLQTNKHSSIKNRQAYGGIYMEYTWCIKPEYADCWNNSELIKLKLGRVCQHNPRYVTTNSFFFHRYNYIIELDIV